MSTVESVTQSVRPETGVSEDDLVIMDYTESDKEVAGEAGADETCTQTDRCHRRRGRCGRRKMMGKHFGDAQSDDESGSFRCEKRKLKRKAMKWMRKMMMRRMMMRMCYGPPRLGFGFGCRRRRMMSAMMDSLDTTTSDDSRSEAEDSCGRRRRCGRRMHPRRNENVKEGQAANTQKQPEGAGTQTDFPEKEGSAIQVAAEKSASAPTDGTVEKDKGEMTQRRVCFREAPRHGRCMGRRRCHHHHHHHHQSSSGTSSSSDSSSDSSSSSSEDDDDDVQNEKDRRCRRRRDGGAQGRDQAVGGEEKKKGKKCGKGDRKAWKGKKFHKKFMKGMHKGYYRRFC